MNTLYTQAGAEIVEALEQAFLRCCSMATGTDWNDRESEAFQSLCGSLSGVGGLPRNNVYLGGDIIRPYLSLCLGDQLWMTYEYDSRGLSRPRLIAEIEGGEGRKGSNGLITRSITINQQLADRLHVPSVYLATLTNLSRYQTRRYPLNIGRLAQWLRFQHVGHVRASDLALTFGGDLAKLTADIQLSRPDILGISLNFGELNTLADLISSIRKTDLRPLICLGNVLAAWAAEEVTAVCAGFQVFISYSYGERELEDLCLSFRKRPMAEEQFDNQQRYGGEQGGEVFIGPKVIVLPDEGLLAETLRQGGQASIETSFGCQYGRCTFCPRDHRGKGWRRPAPEDACAVIENMGKIIRSVVDNGSGVLSIVDEDAFGEEGIDLNCEEPSVVGLIKRAGEGIRCEIYARLEQIFHRRRSEHGSKRRLQQLLDMKPYLSRVFVGLESGSDSQLRRYGKGQTVRESIEALQAASLLGLPLEFGFITFDPLLTQSELIENIEFLARTDILLSTASSEVSVEDVYSMIGEEKGHSLKGNAVFTRVAYMATELELFVNSPFLRLLKNNYPQLLGEFDGSFARFGYKYHDQVVGRIASWCRVWTEGTFKLIYRMRLAARTYGDALNPDRAIITRYREATFGLLVALTGRLSTGSSARIEVPSTYLDSGLPVNWVHEEPRVEDLDRLWRWVLAGSGTSQVLERVKFNLEHLERRRDA